MSGSNSGQQLADSMGHPQEKSKTGNFIGKITGANQVEKVLDTAYNYVTGQQGNGSGPTAGGGGGGAGGAAQSGNGATGTK